MLFQWIRIIIGGLLRFLWHPVKATPWFDGTIAPVPPTSSGEWIAAAKAKLSKVSEEYAQMGDAGKFFPLCVAASGYAVEAIDTLRKFWTLDPVPRFRRSLDPQDDGKAFSIDQASGMLYTLAELLSRGLLTDEDKARLTQVFNHITFSGAPMCVPGSQGKKSFLGVGQIYRPGPLK